MTLNGTNGMKLQENGTDILDITDDAAVTFASGTGQALILLLKQLLFSNLVQVT